MTKKKQKAPRASDMTAAEVTRIRKQLGLSTKELSEKLGVHPITITKWQRTGKTRQKVGYAYARLLRLMATLQK